MLEADDRKPKKQSFCRTEPVIMQDLPCQSLHMFPYAKLVDKRDRVLEDDDDPAEYKRKD
jgi:hypothetical protein